MIESLSQYPLELYQSFASPQKRVFWGYLLSALLISVIWLMVVGRQSLFSTLSFLFSKKQWLSPSARIDYVIFLLNKLFMLLLSPILVLQLTVAAWIFLQLHSFFPGSVSLISHWSESALALLFMLSYFLVDDFSRFYLHRLMHRVPFLWAFHKVHHTAEVLTPMTIFRTHPVEAVLFSLRSLLVQAIVTSLFLFLAGGKVDLVTLLGAGIITFLFNALGSNLRHSPVPITYWRPLESILISPAQHQIHHSISERHWNKNYGVVLAVWDKLAGSLYYAEKKQSLVFGVPSSCSDNVHSLYSVYVQPLLDGSRLAIIFCARLRSKMLLLTNKYFFR